MRFIRRQTQDGEMMWCLGKSVDKNEKFKGHTPWCQPEALKTKTNPEVDMKRKNEDHEN